MAKGVYPLVRAATTCGCELKIDVLLAMHPRHIGASSVAAAAISFGYTTVVLQDAPPYSSLTITGSDNDVVLSNPTRATSHSFSGVVATAKIRQNKKGTSYGWQVNLPGGGYFLAFAWKAFGQRFFSVWVNLPDATHPFATGLCGQQCTGFPQLPNTQCDEENVCLPVFLNDTVFPAATLSILEAVFSLPQSTRKCPVSPTPPAASPPPPSPKPPPGVAQCAPWQESAKCAGSSTRSKEVDGFDKCVAPLLDKNKHGSSESEPHSPAPHSS